MKIIHSSRRHHYVARGGIFLVTVALVVWMVGCGQPAYTLTIASTAGGSVTTPGEGTSTYDEGTVVSLVASPASGYLFVNWTGDVGTIANVNAASTTITMNRDYSITANFVAVYDLTISSTAGGSVTTPGEGTFTYDQGTVVNLVAEAEEGYQVGNWTGDVGTIADVNAAATNITMNGDYSITANFEAGWIKNPTNGHYYALTPPLTWMQAEAWAQEWGGHLVTLRSWEEELWIKDTFGRYEHFWIGFNDIEEEGNWVWSSGEPVVYTNWDEGEPNNCGGFEVTGFCHPEDAAVMNWFRSGLETIGDYWNDLPSGGQLRGVAEIVTIDG